MICYLWSVEGKRRRQAIREMALNQLRRGAENLDSGADDDLPGGGRGIDSHGLRRVPIRVRDEDHNPTPPDC